MILLFQEKENEVKKNDKAAIQTQQEAKNSFIAKYIIRNECKSKINPTDRRKIKMEFVMW